VLAQWLAIYERSFPRQVRVTPHVIAGQIGPAEPGSAAGDVLHVAAAMDGGVVVGGAMFSLLRRSGLGFVSYIFTAADTRGQGVGTWTYRRLVGALGADAAQNRQPLQGVIFEVEREELAETAGEREERIRRLRFFTRMGARILTGLDYLQPPLHAGDAPLRMHLLFDPAGSPEPLPSGDRVLSWITDAYDSIYVRGSGLEAGVVAPCLQRARDSMGHAPVGMRRPG
jgi:GNAT superfamily N-acetyltransferase